MLVANLSWALPPSRGVENCDANHEEATLESTQAPLQVCVRYGTREIELGPGPVHGGCGHPACT